MIQPQRLHELMQLTIAEAAKSTHEDGDVHPLVGAVLSRGDGTVIHTAHRGERGAGDHAEFICLQKAAEAHTNLAGCVLFVTLEPCTARGAEKTPCTTRILSSGVKKIYIGMLDPNPVICGRGETRLRFDIEVERFPGELVREIEELNKDFVNLHRRSHLSASSLYVKRQIPDLIRGCLPAADCHRPRSAKGYLNNFKYPFAQHEDQTSRQSNPSS
jgi:pyrimidine deaminase RibD-like protein